MGELGLREITEADSVKELRDWSIEGSSGFFITWKLKSPKMVAKIDWKEFTEPQAKSWRQYKGLFGDSRMVMARREWVEVLVWWHVKLCVCGTEGKLGKRKGKWSEGAIRSKLAMANLPQGPTARGPESRANIHHLEVLQGKQNAKGDPLFSSSKTAKEIFREVWRYSGFCLWLTLSFRVYNGRVLGFEVGWVMG